MCNPRRVRVTATEQINEAWEREVRRAVQMSGTVSAEARLRQPLDASIGEPALRALEYVMAETDSGWTEVEGGFRHNVNGGYVLYHPDDYSLEIVAHSADVVSVEVTAAQTIQGEVSQEVSQEGEDYYYEDEWGGRTRQVGLANAEEKARQAIEEERKRLVQQAQTDADQQTGSQVEAEATLQAEQKWNQQAQQREAELAAQARASMDSVGLQGRRAFYQMLARAYRNAIVAYAGRNGATMIKNESSGDIVEIEFTVRR